jgi:hypothetical protein
MKRLPSTSSIVAPEPRVTKSGVPPTDLNARTGLSTPPGRTREARWKSVRLVVVFMIQIVRSFEPFGSFVSFRSFGSFSSRSSFEPLNDANDGTFERLERWGNAWNGSNDPNETNVQLPRILAASLA